MQLFFHWENFSEKKSAECNSTLSYIVDVQRASIMHHIPVTVCRLASFSRIGKMKLESCRGQGLDHVEPWGHNKVSEFYSKNKGKPLGDLSKRVEWSVLERNRCSNAFENILWTVKWWMWVLTWSFHSIRDFSSHSANSLLLERSKNIRHESLGGILQHVFFLFCLFLL